MKTFALALVLAAVPQTVRAADPFVGTYRLNSAKSATSGGQLPAEMTLTISEDAGNLLVATSGKTATGGSITADVLILPKAGGTVKA
ncbi:MAG TPA: hypothetical protein VM819_13605, partial [Vicinamibacterales bacterium]|nr:hypothetical protein [Vicinamibacterales bacterium]